MADSFKDNSSAVITVCHTSHELLEMICYSLHSYYLPGTFQTGFLERDVSWTFFFFFFLLSKEYYRLQDKLRFDRIRTTVLNC